MAAAYCDIVDEDDEEEESDEVLMDGGVTGQSSGGRSERNGVRKEVEESESVREKEVKAQGEEKRCYL